MPVSNADILNELREISRALRTNGNGTKGSNNEVIAQALMTAAEKLSDKTAADRALDTATATAVRFTGDSGKTPWTGIATLILTCITVAGGFLLTYLGSYISPIQTAVTELKQANKEQDSTMWAQLGALQGKVEALEVLAARIETLRECKDK